MICSVGAFFDHTKDSKNAVYKASPAYGIMFVLKERSMNYS